MAKNETPRTPDVAVKMDAATNTLTYTFGDGVVETFNASELNAEILSYALLHGLKQKTVDAAAIARNKDTGASATIAEKREAIMAVIQQLRDGDWNSTREGEGTSGQGLLTRALGRLYPERDIKTFVGGLSKEQQAAMRATERVRAVIDTIKAEDAARKPGVKSVDVDALFAQLG